MLHDRNLACRYADHIVAMRDGAIAAEWQPRELVDTALAAKVFGLDSQVVADLVSDTPLVVPIGRHHAAAHRGEGASQSKRETIAIGLDEHIPVNAELRFRLHHPSGRARTADPQVPHAGRAPARTPTSCPRVPISGPRLMAQAVRRPATDDRCRPHHTGNDCPRLDHPRPTASTSVAA